MQTYMRQNERLDLIYIYSLHKRTKRSYYHFKMFLVHWLDSSSIIKIKIQHIIIHTTTKTQNRDFSSDPNESWSSIRYSTSAIHFNGSSSFILNQFPGSTCVTLRVLKLLLDRKPIRNRVLYFKHSFLQIAMYMVPRNIEL